MNNETGLRKIVFSGTCMCGHSSVAHHGHFATKSEVIAAWGTNRHPGACLAYACFDKEGQDTSGGIHCHAYVDALNPDANEKLKWLGTTAESYKAGKKQ